ncbi:hypothetical protein GCM10007962_08760 [Yeosuana aromativorans]|uniref:MAM domain-containing protein n=1 Tax=Yeosuana aromativorans TaxID=288019 RepID=A0A8J3FF63_9FLAO|nr:choice-of-anchor D domain-containing protein [Yeosuana aromativorans]GGK16739.1 hypothetical protein GCM10007962_08760 [Yeosuana aromativorans]
MKHYINNFKLYCFIACVFISYKSISQTCTTTVSTFPYSEGFESGIGGWIQDSGDNFDWIRDSGGTPSSNTGPSTGHSSTWYMYTEASSNNNNTGNLISPCFDLTSASAATFSFWYHMYGSDMGTLNVELSTDNGSTYPFNLWSQTGQVQTSNGQAYNQVSLDLSSYVGQIIKIRFRGVTGNNYRSDMAIDDVAVTATIIPMPEINITGSGNSIVSGDITPSASDDTDFGNVDITIGTNANTFTIQNTGTATLNLTGSSPYVAISGTNAADFTVTGIPSTSIATGSSTTFTITFNPSAIGLRSATVTIANNDGNENPYTFTVQGNGTSAVQEINVLGNSNSIVNGDSSPTTLDDTDFGNTDITVGSVVHTFTIENLGTVTNLNLTSGSPYVVVSGVDASDFTVTTIPTTPITASSSTTFNITFNPSSTGLKSATLTIANDDLDESIYSFDIQGTGVIIKAPGGVDTNLELWLKGNAGLGYTNGQPVTTWQDQTSNAYNATAPVAGVEPTYRDDPAYNINFNPVVDFDNSYSTFTLDTDFSFDNTSTEFLQGSGGFYSEDIFVVLIPDTTINSSFGSMDVFCGDENIAANETDATGIGLGAYSVRFSGEIISYAHGTTSGGLGYGVAETGTGSTYSNAGIINVRNNTAVTQQELYYNAKNIETIQNDVPDFANVNNTRYWIGRSEGWEATTDARIAEIITYSSRKNDTDLTQERNRIQSYLAIKYGITLGTNGTSQDYVDSSGNVIWDQSANSGFNYDIAGIGRDDISELNQKQSSSINNATDGTGPIQGILTIGLTDIYNTNNENISTNPTTLNNKEFLVWGDNGADLNLAAMGVSVNMSAGITPALSTPVSFVAMQRIWKVVENGGDIPSCKVRIPQNAVRNISPPGSYLMFISDTGIFDPTSDYRVMTSDGNGNLEANYDFDGTKYITFGYAPQVVAERSINFDGVADYIDMENNLDLNPSAFTISAWVKRDTGTVNASILSKRDATYTEGYDFKINGSGQFEFDLNGGAATLTSSVAIPENEWHQLSVIYNAGTATLYIDGVADTSASSLPAPIATSQSFYIAAAGKNTPTDFFAGNIDEVRVWDTALTEAQLRYIMNQEIIDNSLALVYGNVLPTSITKNEISSIPWSDLAGYYPMSVYTYTNTNDMSGNGHQGALRNLDTVDRQTAPLPYQTQASGPWDTDATWLNNSVQSLPNDVSIIDGTTPIDWNIVEINHDVSIKTKSSLGRERSVQGLIINSGNLLVDGDTACGCGNGLTITHYLKLNGTIDLEGESQLIQTTGSDLDPTSSGTLQRDQQGTKDLYTYNYWSSPVGISNTTTNNNSYKLPDVLKDGSVPTNPLPITFLTSGYDGSPGTPGVTPISIADYWIWKYANKTSDSYPLWQHVRSTGTILAGEGFTMKGVQNTGGAISLEQNYVFKGKPNNGDISLTLSPGNDYLIGNPYASALDADEFILDNINSSGGRATSDIFDGALYFWEHFASSTHILREYQGGYGTYNLMGATKAISNDARINATGTTGTKTPQRYIPVSQGFFVTADTGGTLTFKNSQRIFKTEASDPSLFIKPIGNIKGSQPNSKKGDTREKIKLLFDSPKGYHRQLLTGIDNHASNGIDVGYDAPLIEDNVEDIYWTVNDKKFIIQAVNNFNDDQILPLGMKINKKGLATIKIDTLENIPANLSIFIKDKELNLIHDLKESNYQVYLNPGVITDRFEIVFNTKQDTTLSTDEKAKDLLNVFYSNEESSLILQNPNLKQIQSAELLNILGQSIIKFKTIEQVSYQKLKTKHLVTGTYIIELKTIDGSITKKVIIQ